VPILPFLCLPRANRRIDTNNPLAIPASALPQPIPIDVDGDMKIDLLGMTPSSQGSSSSPFQVWQNVWNASQPHAPLFTVYARLAILSLQLILYSADPLFNGAQCKMANPHSNAVVDLDGDCLAGTPSIPCRG
jgi:integrin alpha FG-GAP repeat containing protein 1